MTIPTCPHARRDKTRLTAQLQTLPHFTANASNPMLGKFIRALLRPIAAQYGLFVALLLRNTGSLSPYCYAIRALCRPIATQYGLRLRLCAHCVARIRLRYRPISRVALNTGSLSSRGCAPLTPGCILAPFQGALFPLAIFVTSAVGRCPFPLAIYGEGGDRQAGGEVRQAGGMVKTPLMERPPPIFN